MVNQWWRLEKGLDHYILDWLTLLQTKLYEPPNFEAVKPVLFWRGLFDAHFEKFFGLLIDTKGDKLFIVNQDRLT